MLTEVKELNGIAMNLVMQILDGTYTQGEAIHEVMPFEFNLSGDEKAYVAMVVDNVIRLLNKPKLMVG